MLHRWWEHCKSRSVLNNASNTIYATDTGLELVHWCIFRARSIGAYGVNVPASKIYIRAANGRTHLHSSLFEQSPSVKPTTGRVGPRQLQSLTESKSPFAQPHRSVNSTAPLAVTMSHSRDACDNFHRL